MADLALGVAPRRPTRWLAALNRGGARLWLGATIVLLLLLVALAAPLLAPHDPRDQDLLSAQLPPAFLKGGDKAFPLGTDSLGRCVLSRLIYAARTAIEVALIAATLAAVIGIVLGLLAASFGGWVDQGISRLIDVWMAFPPVLLSIVLAAVIGAGLTSVFKMTCDKCMLPLALACGARNLWFSVDAMDCARFQLIWQASFSFDGIEVASGSDPFAVFAASIFPISIFKEWREAIHRA